MHRDGHEIAKHRAKYRCPKANRRVGCFYGRTVQRIILD